MRLLRSVVSRSDTARRRVGLPRSVTTPRSSRARRFARCRSIARKTCKEVKKRHDAARASLSSAEGDLWTTEARGFAGRKHHRARDGRHRGEVIERRVDLPSRRATIRLARTIAPALSRVRSRRLVRRSGDGQDVLREGTLPRARCTRQCRHREPDFHARAGASGPAAHCPRRRVPSGKRGRAPGPRVA